MGNFINQIKLKEFLRFFRKNTITLIIFSALLIVSTFSIYRDVSEKYNTNFFSFLQGIFLPNTIKDRIAQALFSDVTSDGREISSPIYYQDNFERCLVLNPNNKRNPVKTVGELGGYTSSGKEISNKGGINNGTILSGFQQVIDFLRNNRLEMGYILAIATSPGEAGSAYDFIVEANEANLMPIIRLCFPGGCSFRGPSDIVSFYEGINSRLAGSDYEYIGVVGPNEPGTAGEMESFGVALGDYATIVSWSNQAATMLQSSRVSNGGNMYIAPVIFNLSNTQNDDVVGYLYSSPQIDPTLFDYLMGNTYLISGLPAEFFYDQPGRSVRSYAEDNDLLTIISEYGYLDDQSAQPFLPSLQSSYSALCNDETVDGILFFRPFYSELDAPAPRQEPQIPSQEVKRMIDSCDEKPKKPGGGNSKWVNCNFDSCVYEESGSSNINSSSITNNNNDFTRAISLGNTQSVCSEIYQNNQTKTAILNFGDSLADEAQTGLPNMVQATFPGASSRWFLADRENRVNLDSIKSSNLFAARIILGTNDCPGVPINEFEDNLRRIVESFTQSGIIPILVTIPAKTNPSCIGSLVEWNSVIERVAGSRYPLIRAHLLYTSSELRDGTHLRDRGEKINQTTQQLISQLTQACGNNISIGEVQSTTQQFFVSNSESIMCGFELQKKDPEAFSQSKSGFLRVDCSSGVCKTASQQTVQVWMPIKHFGSNLSVGTKTRSYIPTCVEISRFLADQKYDALNQFAGSLKDLSGNIYPMPWLGSAINCASNLAIVGSDFSLDQWKSFNPSIGSLSNHAVIEAQSDLARGLSLDVLNVDGISVFTDNEGNRYVPEERTICLNQTGTTFGSCFLKDNTNTELMTFRNYSPFDTPSQVKRTEACNSNILIKGSGDDYLPGPEVKVGGIQENVIGSPGELCWQYARRNVDPEVKAQMSATARENLCVFNRNKTFNVGTTFVNCAWSTSQCANNQGIISRGNCDTIQPFYANCFDYNPDPNAPIFMRMNAGQSYPEIPKFRIEEAYDALNIIYDKLQTKLSTRNLRLVVRENVGWRVEVDGIVRDANFPFNFGGEYLFKGEIEEVCRNTEESPYGKSNFIDNSIGKAKGNSVKKEYQYHDWLGYIDILQELMMVYSSNSTLPDIEFKPNPIAGSTLLTTEESLVTNTIPVNSNVSSENACILPGSENLVSVAEDYLGRLTQGFSNFYNKPINQQDEVFANYWNQSLYERACGTNASCPYNWNTPNVNDLVWCTVYVIKVYERVFPELTQNLNWSSVSLMLSRWGSVFGPVISVEQANAQRFQNNLIPLGSAVFFGSNHAGIVCDISVDSDGNGSITICEANSTQLRRSFPIESGRLRSGGQLSIHPITHFGLPPSGTLNNGVCEANSISVPRQDIPFEEQVRLLGERQNYLSSGIANLFTSFPILSCDEVILLKLGIPAQTLGLPEGFSLRPEDDLTCITYQKDPGVVDKLALEMCQRGYSVRGLCENQCINPNSSFAQSASFYFSHPLEGDPRISQRFNNCQRENGVCYYHNGVDYAVPTGTPVFASAPGIVQIIRTGCEEEGSYEARRSCNSGAGNYIRILHDQFPYPITVRVTDSNGNNIGVKTTNNIYTDYQHLSRIESGLREGQRVGRGELIGYVGNTGNSTAPHLHWGAKHTLCSDSYTRNVAGSCSFDPTLYMNQNISNLCVQEQGNANIFNVRSSNNPGLDCLINQVAQQTNVPPSLLKSIMILESGWFSNPDTGRPLTGDPAEISRRTPNSAGAVGPMQFTLGAWNRIVNNEDRRRILESCTSFIGLTGFGDISNPELRAVTGIAICAAGIHLRYTVENHMNSSYYGTSLMPQVIASVTRHLGAEYAIPDRNYLESGWDEMAVKIAAYRYFGACDIGQSILRLPNSDGRIGTQTTANYCNFVYTWHRAYESLFENIICANSPRAILNEKREYL